MLEEVKQLLAETLQLGDRADAFDESTVLLGSLPELDSMAVVTLIAAMEDHYGFVVEDDEISADTFATLGALTQFVEAKSEL
ncbi:MAG: phosphopantetheine-binding protein [Pseudomonadota bacterium]